MNSIRIRLFLILLAATGAAWLLAVLWIQSSTRAEVERALDARLAEAGAMVSSLMASQRPAERRAAAPDAARGVDDAFAAAPPRYAHRLSCQIWSLRGDLIGRSAAAPQGRLSAGRAGYATSLVDGARWRVYTVVDPEAGIEVMVGDSLAVRARLVADMRDGLLWSGLAVLPLLALAIWISVGRGLAPIDRLAAALAAREASDFSPASQDGMPREIRPFLAALNGLFRRAEAARSRERVFTAYAAHELKTPLAALKTQAQVARAAPDAQTRDRALARIEASVDRSDRLARQLLALAQIESAVAAPAEPAPVSEAVAAVAAELAPMAARAGVRLRLSGGETAGAARDASLLISALRNVVENAVQASPAGAEVAIAAEGPGVLAVIDQGPGVPEAELGRITDRFYRGARPSGPGSGLGLAIASAALARLGGALEFARGAPAGQIVRLRFAPASAP